MFIVCLSHLNISTMRAGSWSVLFIHISYLLHIIEWINDLSLPWRDMDVPECIELNESSFSELFINFAYI